MQTPGWSIQELPSEQFCSTTLYLHWTVYPQKKMLTWNWGSNNLAGICKHVKQMLNGTTNSWNTATMNLWVIMIYRYGAHKKWSVTYPRVLDAPTLTFGPTIQPDETCVFAPMFAWASTIAPDSMIAESCTVAREWTMPPPFSHLRRGLLPRTFGSPSACVAVAEITPPPIIVHIFLFHV